MTADSKELETIRRLVANDKLRAIGIYLDAYRTATNPNATVPSNYATILLQLNDALPALLSTNEALARKNERRGDALERMIYEATHLSATEDDGSHICKISAETLAIARQALEPSHDQ